MKMQSSSGLTSSGQFIPMQTSPSSQRPAKIPPLGFQEQAPEHGEVSRTSNYPNAHYFLCFRPRHLRSGTRNGCREDGLTRKPCFPSDSFSSPSIKCTSNAEPCTAVNQLRYRFHCCTPTIDKYFVKTFTQDFFHGTIRVSGHETCGKASKHTRSVARPIIITYLIASWRDGHAQFPIPGGSS